MGKVTGFRMHDVHGDLVLRPSVRNGLITLAFAVVCTAGVVVAAAAGPAPSAFAWVFGALFAVVVVPGAGSLIRSRITVNPHEIVTRGLVFRRRRPRSRAVAAVRATILGARGTASDSLFLLDAHHGVLLRMRTPTYARDDLDRLVSVLGVPCTGPDRAVSVNEFGKEYPDLVPWVVRHPNLLGLAILGVVCVVALVAALVTTVS